MYGGSTPAGANYDPVEAIFRQLSANGARPTANDVLGFLTNQHTQALQDAQQRLQQQEFTQGGDQFTRNLALQTQAENDRTGLANEQLAFGGQQAQLENQYKNKALQYKQQQDAANRAMEERQYNDVVMGRTNRNPSALATSLGQIQASRLSAPQTSTGYDWAGPYQYIPDWLRK